PLCFPVPTESVSGQEAWRGSSTRRRSFVGAVWEPGSWILRAPKRRDNPTRLKECAMPSKRLTLQQRQEIFHTLVLTQDVVPNVPGSRQIVSEKFDITEAQLRQIEDEGLENEWPPLSEAVTEVG